MTRLVIIESPYAGDVDGNLLYARAALADCLARGESPYASHLLLTQEGVLDDGDPTQRAVGVAAGHAWYAVAEACVVYRDKGISVGMAAGIAAAQRAGVPVEYRTICNSWPLEELVPQPRLLPIGVACGRCGRTWDPAKGERSGCATCINAIQSMRGGR